jgi:hypothetical protein
VAASVDALRPCRTIYVFPAAFIVGWAKRSESAKSRPIIRDADRLGRRFPVWLRGLRGRDRRGRFLRWKSSKTFRL